MARRMQLLRWVGRAITGLVVIIALAIATVLLVIPQLNGGAALTVLSGSMTPTYPVGSVVIVEPIEPQDIQVDDVITFATATSLTTHRVLEVVPDETGELSFITKGDANKGPDQDPVKADAVRGRVSFHVPFIGEVRDVLSTPLGLGLIALLAGLSAAWERVTGFVRRYVPLPSWMPTQDPPAPTPAEDSSRQPVHNDPTSTEHFVDQTLVTGPRLGLRQTTRVEQQFLLARIDVRTSVRREVLEVLDLVGGQVVALGPRHMVVSVSGSPAHLDGVEELLRPCGIVETQRSQVLSVGGQSMPEAATEPFDRSPPASVSPSFFLLGPPDPALVTPSRR